MDIYSAAISAAGTLIASFGGAWIGSRLRRKEQVVIAEKLLELEKIKIGYGKLWEYQKDAFEHIYNELGRAYDKACSINDKFLTGRVGYKWYGDEHISDEKEFRIIWRDLYNFVSERSLFVGDEVVSYFNDFKSDIDLHSTGHPEDYARVRVRMLKTAMMQVRSHFNFISGS